MLLILRYVVVSRLWVIYQKMKTLDLSLSRRIGYKKFLRNVLEKNSLSLMILIYQDGIIG